MPTARSRETERHLLIYLQAVLSRRTVIGPGKTSAAAGVNGAAASDTTPDALSGTLMHGGSTGAQLRSGAPCSRLHFGFARR